MYDLIIGGFIGDLEDEKGCSGMSCMMVWEQLKASWVLDNDY